jgi:aspartate aminotransferase-like enzyme
MSEAVPMLLMTPGPTRVPDRVLGAGARPMVHHRSRAFLTEFAEMLRLIGPVFGSQGPVLPVHTTGRGAMEATICNLCSRGDEVVVCTNGRFGELWARIAETYGLVVHRVATDWTRDIEAAEVEAALDRHPRARVVAITYTDTSTGVVNDVAGLGRIARGRGALLFVDGVSAIGGMPFEFDEWDVDVALTGSQKCLMSAPGLSFVAVSDRARAASAAATLPRGYWDFQEIRAHAMLPRPDTAGTPPVHVMLQVAEALRMMHEETLTAMTVPAGLAPQQLRDALEARGVLVAEALGPFAGSCVRIGHMGDIRLPDLRRTFDTLDAVLHEHAAAMSSR